MSKTPEQILREAARLVERGWVQGLFFDRYRGQDCYCALGALAVATSGDAYGRCDKGAERCLEEVVGPSVALFNDDPRTTQRDVIAALEIAADLAAPEWVP